MTVTRCKQPDDYRAVGKSIIQIQNSSNRINHLSLNQKAISSRRQLISRNMEFCRPFEKGEFGISSHFMEIDCNINRIKKKLQPLLG